MVLTVLGVGTKLRPWFRSDSLAVPSRGKSEKFVTKGLGGVLTLFWAFLLYWGRGRNLRQGLLWEGAGDCSGWEEGDSLGGLLRSADTSRKETEVLSSSGGTGLPSPTNRFLNLCLWVFTRVF